VTKNEVDISRTLNMYSSLRLNLARPLLTRHKRNLAEERSVRLVHFFSPNLLPFATIKHQIAFLIAFSTLYLNPLIVQLMFVCSWPVNIPK